MSTQPTIREGATGHVVRWAQYLLVRRELSYSDIDGIFGPYTRAAVERFQAGAGIVVDGVVGPITWGALGGEAPQPPTLRAASPNRATIGSATAFTVPLGKVIDTCFRLRTASRGSRVRILWGSSSPTSLLTIRFPSGPGRKPNDNGVNGVRE